jgi:PAS domain S-box-containing protein
VQQDNAAFLADGGEAGAMLRARDWSATSLGPVERWPAELRVMLSTVINSPVLGAVLWGPELLMLYNDAYIPSLAERHPAAFGRPVAEVWGDAWAQVSAPFYTCLATGKGFEQRDVELTVTRNGVTEHTHWDFSAAAIRGDDGTILGLLNQGFEITAQVKAQRALVAAETSSAQVLDATSEAFYAVDRDGVTTLCNAAFVAMLGFENKDAVIGRALHGVIHHSHPDGAHYDRADCPIYQAAALGVAAHVTDELFFRLDGTPFPVDYRAEPIFRDGVLTGAICTFSDISERKADRDALAAMNDNLERLVVERTAERDRMWDTSLDLLLVLDFDGIFRRVNPAWTTILGYAPDELVGHHANAFIIAEDNAETVEAYQTAAEGGTPRIENRYRHKDGSQRWISWVAAPAQGVIYATGRDVTGEKTRTAELAATQDALRQSQKMEAVGQLTGGLAHDFNNLLTGVMGNLELLQSRLSRGRFDDLERFVTNAQGAGRRAAALTQRLLAFSRRQTLDPRPTDINRLIAGLEEMLRRTVGPANVIEVVGMVGLWTAMIDAGQLENALLNLCINARDAMPDGGRITIETANKWMDERAARERDLPPGQYLSICVTDTGTGMSEDVISRAFDPFYTTKPIGQGTGLGLSMIYGFARQSGGQVRIYSEPGEGTTVCVYLPRHVGDADAVADEPDALALGDGAGATVLIVDDEASIRHLVDEILDESGYTVIGAADGAAGIKVLQSGAKIELLITDVGLPNGMNGRQVADAARMLRPGLKVLFITGYAENAAVGNGHLEPGMALLTKPFAMADLVRKVQEMLAKPAVG